MVVVEELRRAAGAVLPAERLALACHIGPDGDALGSMLGLGIAARDAGKEVVASFGTPFAIPGNLAFLPSDLLIPPGEFPETPDVMIVFDAGSADRLGELSKNAGAAETLIVLDHHVTNGGFGDIAAIDGDAAATAELVMDLLDILGWPITKEVANCLHTALVTDTGRFQYTNTSPQTLLRAARLVEAGASPDEISRHVYEEAPFGYLQVAGAALNRVTLDADLAMVSTVLTHEDLAQAGIDWGDVDNLINTIRLAQEADVAALAKVHDDGRVKMSLRSRGATDVGAIALQLGGGGHRLAAGFTFHGTAEQAIAAVRDLIEAHR